MSEDWPPPASAPFSRIPSNQEWAETKAWTRQFMSNRRELERAARREWIEGVRRRLGLVAEVHRCYVYDDDEGDGWAWSCRRWGCRQCGHGYRQRAIEHARQVLSWWEPIEGDRKAIRELYFTSNPAARGHVNAPERVAEILREARAVIAAGGRA